MKESNQLDMFGSAPIEWEISEMDVINHKERMRRQAKDKAGAISRIIKSRYDDMLSHQIATENLRLKKEIESLKKIQSAAI